MPSDDEEPKIINCDQGSVSGVNQFQDLLEAEVAKENEADDENEDEYDDEDSYDEEDEDIFQPDASSIRADIDAFLKTQSPFQKIQQLSVQFTNQWVREICKFGKITSADSKNVEARGSQVKEFFLR